LNRNQEIEVSNKLIKNLKERGFRINKYYAKTTKSIYLKLDYGVCCGIRISDHKGKKKYRYKFNLIKKYNGPKQINDKGYIRLFYDYNNTEELVDDVQNEKKAKINKYGLYNYQEYMKQNSQDNLYKSFKNVA
jgi:hypothetical protein